MKDILRRFPRVWLYQNRRLIHRLRWHHPGIVWAVDHVWPGRSVDRAYPHVILVRDLASQYQFAWQPVPGAGAETRIAILASLFWEHGSPLVFRSDNGSGGIAHDTRELLDLRGMLHIPNHATKPQYKGSCEAAGGSHKKITDDQAILAAHPALWASKDLHQACMIRNRVGRPDGTED